MWHWLGAWCDAAWVWQEVDRIYETGGPKEVSLLEAGQEKVRLRFSADNAGAQVSSLTWLDGRPATAGCTTRKCSVCPFVEVADLMVICV